MIDGNVRDEIKNDANQSIQRQILQLTELSKIVSRYLEQQNLLLDSNSNYVTPEIIEGQSNQVLKTLSLCTAHLSQLCAQHSRTNQYSHSQTTANKNNDLNSEKEAALELVSYLRPSMLDFDENNLELAKLTNDRMLSKNLASQLPDYLRTKPLPEAEMYCDDILSRDSSNDSKFMIDFIEKFEDVYEHILAKSRLPNQREDQKVLNSSGNHHHLDKKN